jgi:hypothetical protein
MSGSNKSGGISGVLKGGSAGCPEALLLQALLVESAVEQSRSNPDHLQAIGRAAARGAMDVDLASMTLTDRGMVSAR